MTTTKVTRLTKANLSALDLIDSRVPITTAGTYATFGGTPEQALIQVQAFMDAEDRAGRAKGHPRSSLVAVRNKLRDAASAPHWPATGPVTPYVTVTDRWDGESEGYGSCGVHGCTDCT